MVLGALAVVLLAGGGSRGSVASVKHHSSASKRTSKAVHTGKAAGPSPAATTTSATSAQTSTRPPTTTTAAAPAAPSLVAGAGRLTALLTADAEAGGIRPHAARALSSELDKLLSSYAAGHSTNIQPEMADLAQQVATLQRNGQIGAAAAPALAAAMADLETAIGRSVPEAHTEGPTPGPPRALAEPDPPGRGPGHHGRGHDH